MPNEQKLTLLQAMFEQTDEESLQALVESRVDEVNAELFDQLIGEGNALAADDNHEGAMYCYSLAHVAAFTRGDPLDKARVLLAYGNYYRDHSPNENARKAADHVFREGKRLVEPILLQGGPSVDLYFRLTEGLAHISSVAQEWKVSKEVWSEALPFFRGNRLFTFWAHFFLTLMNYHEKDYKTAVTHGLEAAELFRSNDFEVTENIVRPNKKQLCGVLYGLGRALRSNDALKEGVKIFTALIEIAPSFDDADFQLGFCLMFDGEFDAAEQQWASIQEADHRYPDALANRAQCLGALGRTEKALGLIEEAIQRRSEEANNRLIRAGLLQDLGRHEEAAGDYGKFLRMATNADTTQVIQARSSRAASLCEIGHLDDSLAEATALEGSIDEEVRQAGRRLRAILLEDDGDAVVEHLDAARETGTPSITNQLAEIHTLLTSDRYDEFLQKVSVIAAREQNPLGAIDMLEAYLKRRPGDHQLRRVRAYALLQAARPDEAVPELTAILEHDPDDAEALHWRGLAQLTSRYDPDETGWNDGLSFSRIVDAYGDLVAAVRLEPASTKYRDAFIWLFDRVILNPSGAVIALHFCGNHLELLPDFQRAWIDFEMGNRLAGENHWKEAIEHLVAAQEDFHALGLVVTAEKLNYRIADNRIRLYQLQQTLDDLDRAKRSLALSISPLTPSLKAPQAELIAAQRRTRGRLVAAFEHEYRGAYDLLFDQKEYLFGIVLKADTLRRVGRHTEATNELEGISIKFKTLAAIIDFRQLLYAVVKVYRDAGETEEALRTIALLHKHEVDEHDQFMLASLQGSVLLLQDKPEAAITYFRESLTCVVDPAEQFVATLQIAESHCSLNQFAEALTLLEGLDSESARSWYETWGYLNCRATARWGMGQSYLALSDILTAVTMLDEHRDQFALLDSRSAWLQEKERFFEFGVRIAADAGRGDVAFQLSEQSKGRTFLDELAVGRAHIEEEENDLQNILNRLIEIRQLLVHIEGMVRRHGGAHIDPELLQRLRELDPVISLFDVDSSAHEDSLSIDRIRSERMRLEDDTENIEQQIERVRFGLADPAETQPTAYDDIRSLLQREQRLLGNGRQVVLAQYHLLAERTVLLVGRADLSVPEVISIPFAVPPEIRDRFVVAFDSEHSEGQQAFDRLMSPLVEPLLKWTNEDDVILFVRHSVIHYIPLHLVRIRGKFLCERNPVSYFPSASMIPRCLAQRHPRTGRSLVYGDPLGDLPYARQEAVNVAAYLQAIPRIGDEASIEMFINDVSGEKQLDTIHMACHGSFDVENPLESGLELAPGPNNDQPMRLTARDLLTHSLPSSLVVFSACDTGLTIRKGGDELIGLARAVLLAGAGSTLLSNWPVNDLSTSMLMLRFYDLIGYGVGGEPLAKCDALRAAQAYVQNLTVREMVEYCDEQLATETNAGPDRRLCFEAVRAAALALSGDEHGAANAYKQLESKLAEADPSLRQSLSPATDACNKAVSGTAAAADSTRIDYCRRPFESVFFWGGFQLIGDWA